MSEIYAHPLPRVYAIFLFAIEYSAKAQPPQHTTTGARPPHPVRGFIEVRWEPVLEINIYIEKPMDLH